MSDCEFVKRLMISARAMYQQKIAQCEFENISSSGWRSELGFLEEKFAAYLKDHDHST